MSHKNRGLKALGLSLIAMAGFMALMAASASAQWLTNNVTIAANKPVEIKNHETHGILLVKTETNLQILCKKLVGEDVLLLSGTKNVDGGLSFSECKTFQGEPTATEKPGCKPLEPIKASGKGKLIAHNSKTYVLFEPLVVGGNFAQVKFNGETCALPETNNVKGSLVVECRKLSDLGTTDCLTEEQVHLLKEAPVQTLFGADGLIYGTKAAVLDGIVDARLPTSENWSGHA